MRIDHLSSTDAFEGAARGAYRVHSGLVKLGHESRFLVARRSGVNADVIRVRSRLASKPLAQAFLRRLDRVQYRPFHQSPLPKTFWSSPRSPFRPQDFSEHSRPDIYNLHWVAGFLDWPTMLPWLIKRAPVVWTMRDLNPLLGVWHYEPNELERTPSRDRIESQAYNLKKTVLSSIPQDRLWLIASSKWMEERMRNSELFGRFNIKCIPHGLNVDAFYPIEKSVAKAALGITSRKCVGFIAGDVTDPRKGYAYLRNALDRVSHEHEFQIVTVGDMHGLADDGAIHLGAVRSDRLLNLFYNALDVFVCPSLQEAFGQTVFESMSCGVPVVAFAVGGIPDMVRPNQTGWLSAAGDSQGLAQNLSEALADPAALVTMGAKCREVAEAEYRQSIQASNYAQYFNHVLSQVEQA